MFKRICFIIIVTYFIQGLTFPNHTIVAEQSVKDCIEAADCEEDEQQPNEERNDEESTDNIADGQIQQPSIIWNFIKMIFALAVVLALIYLLLTFIKKRNQLYEWSNIIQNLGGVSVGQNKSIQIVRIGEQIFVLGVGENVHLLQEITDEELMEQLLVKNEQKTERLSFLQNFLQKNERKKRNDDLSFTAKLEQELENIKENREEIVDRYIRKKDEDRNV